jgi:hypothetical protein
VTSEKKLLPFIQQVSIFTLPQRVHTTMTEKNHHQWRPFSTREQHTQPVPVVEQHPHAGSPVDARAPMMSNACSSPSIKILHSERSQIELEIESVEELAHYRERVFYDRLKRHRVQQQLQLEKESRSEESLENIIRLQCLRDWSDGNQMRLMIPAAVTAPSYSGPASFSVAPLMPRPTATPSEESDHHHDEEGIFDLDL